MKAFPRDVTVQTMKVRHIGVENELEVRGAIGDIQSSLAKRGLLNSIGYDGGGREFRTNPISVRSLKQVRGERYVKEYYEVLSLNTKPINSGGTHIHISILNSDHENMEANATAMAVAFYKQFQKIAGRKSHWAPRLNCSTLDAVKEKLEDRKGWNSGRTYDRMMSMLNPTSLQTLEFRGPIGSNNCAEILAWVEFLENVVKLSNRESVEGVQFKELLKGDRISAYVETLKGWRKLGKRELEMKFVGSKLQ